MLGVLLLVGVRGWWCAVVGVLWLVVGVVARWYVRDSWWVGVACSCNRTLATMVLKVSATSVESIMSLIDCGCVGALSSVVRRMSWSHSLDFWGRLPTLASSLSLLRKFVALVECWARSMWRSILQPHSPSCCLMHVSNLTCMYLEVVLISGELGWSRSSWPGGRCKVVL